MLFAIMSVSLISCGDDDEIGGRDTLVGKWQCTWSEGYEKYANNTEYNDEWNEEGDFTVTFNEDGTVVADGDTGKWKLEGDKLCVRSLPVVLKTIPTSDRINLCRIIYAQSPAEYINKVGSIVERFTCSPIPEPMPVIMDEIIFEICNTWGRTLP